MKDDLDNSNSDSLYRPQSQQRRRGGRHHSKRSSDDRSDSRAGSSLDETDSATTTDDRKPPAREVMVPHHPTNHSTTTASSASRRPRSNSESDTIASSIMTPLPAAAASPMVLIPPSIDKAGLQSSSTPFSLQQHPLPTSTNTTSTSTTPPQQLITRQDFQLREQILERRLLVLAASALFSLAAFLTCILPLNALLYLLLGAASTTFAGQQALEYASVNWENRLRHGGFAELILPPSLYDLLTQRTLHDLLIRLHETSDAAEMELRHMLLYFLPGLTIEQRNSYIQRLPRRHRNMLEQPGGLTQFLGPEALRFLIGEDGVAAQQQQLHRRGRRRPRSVAALEQSPPSTPHIIRLDPENAAAATPLTAMTTTSATPGESERRAMENARPAASLRGDADSASSSSDLGLDISGNDLTGGLSDSQARSMARRLNLSSEAHDHALIGATIPEETSSFDDEDSERDEDDDVDDDESDMDVDNAEMRILVEAALSTVTAELERFFYPAFASAAEYTSRVSRQVASSVASYGYRVALAAGGVGMAGFLITSYRSGGVSSLTNFGLVARDLFRPLSQRGAGSSPNQSMFATLVLGSGGAAAALYWADRALQKTAGDQDDDGSSRKSRRNSSH